jgi:hypothetical protein
VYDKVERAKRFRDGSPVERINMRIEDVQKYLGFLKMVGSTPDAMRETGERIRALQKERDDLIAAST